MGIIITRAAPAAPSQAVAALGLLMAVALPGLLSACAPSPVVGSTAPLVAPPERPPAFIGRPAVAAPLAAPLAPGLAPQNPSLADNGRNSMHGDSANSGTLALAGPLGHQPQVTASARGLLGGECSSVLFDSRGRVLTTCLGYERPALLLLHPQTLRELARYDLPSSHPGPPGDPRRARRDATGGRYFFLDQRGRANIAAASGRLLRIRVDEDQSGPRLVLESGLDLSPVLVREGRRPHRIISALSDWKERLWFASTLGLVGVVPLPEPGERVTRPRVMDLDGERVHNGLAIASDGAYLATDHALYRFTIDDRTGGPALVWREAYDRGTERKSGQAARGTGTTPTLVGDDLIAIVDNGEERARLLVYKRLREVSGERLVCAVPLFEAGQSAVDRSLVAHGRSLVAANSFGQDPMSSMRQGVGGAPGVVRVDVREDLSGCDIVWQSPQTLHPTGMKLSRPTGLLYGYAKRPGRDGGPDAWYLSALDFRTGEHVFGALVGTGVAYDNHQAAVALGPDGAAYLGVGAGLVRVVDGP